MQTLLVTPRKWSLFCWARCLPHRRCQPAEDAGVEPDGDEDDDEGQDDDADGGDVRHDVRHLVRSSYFFLYFKGLVLRCFACIT